MNKLIKIHMKKLRNIRELLHTFQEKRSFPFE